VLPPPDPEVAAGHARGLATARARLGLDARDGDDRRARAEALAAGLLSLRRAAERGVLA
jgi:hypothetical protein